jgi:peptide/nickel transport system substrate-binding protein
MHQTMASTKWMIRASLIGALLTGAMLFAVVARAESVLRAVAASDLHTLDPMIGTDNQTLAHGYMVYDQLFGLDSQYKPQPEMVDRYEVSPDNRIHTFTLRANLKWSDGTDVTAEDCVASIRRWAVKDTEGHALMANTVSLTATDAHSLRWELREPFAGVAANLAKISVYPAFMMPARLATTPADQAIAETIGSGPFRFVAAAWKPSAQWVYERNPYYLPRSEPSDNYAGSRAPHLDRIEFTYSPDQATRAAALKAGEVDMLEDISTDLVAYFAGDKNVIARARDTLGVEVILRFNQLFPPFNNQQIRQAVMLAVDQREFLTAMAGDPQFWQTCASMFYCGTPYGSTSGPFKLGGAPDLTKARALLQAGGYKGEPVVILQPTDNVMSPLALVAADTMQKLGMNVTVLALDYATVMRRRLSHNPPTEGGWSVFFTRWEGALQNPTIFSPIGAACDKAWFGWPCDAEIERLRTTWVHETDPAKQAEIVDQLNARAEDVVPFVNLGQVLSPMAWRVNVTGIPKTATMVYWTIQLQ